MPPAPGHAAIPAGNSRRSNHPPPGPAGGRGGRRSARPRPRGCLAPVEPGDRFWAARDYAYIVLQATMQPQSYMLGGMGLALGLRWQAILVAVFVSSLIVMFTMMLACHPTSSYGIPMPVMARSTFGWFGSKVYSIMFLALCVPWSGWLLGVAAKGLYIGLVELVSEDWLHWDPFNFQGSSLIQVDFMTAALLGGLFLLQMLFFLVGDQVFFIRGFAPSAGMFSLSFYLSLLVWAYQRPGIKASLELLNQLREPGPSFYVAFPMMVAAGVCCWGTLILGLADLGRYAPGSRQVKRGIALMLPLSVTFGAFVGLLGIASVRATFKVLLVVPTEVLQFFPKYLSLIMAVCLAVCITHTIMASYLYPGALALVNFAPPLLNIRLAGIIVGLLSVLACMGLNDTLLYDRWVYYSGLAAGGLTGVILSDYYVVRYRRLPLEGLYRLTHALRFCGFNLPAFMAITAGYGSFAAAGVLKATGFKELPPHFLEIGSWALPFLVSFVSYAILAKLCCLGPDKVHSPRKPSDRAGSQATAGHQSATETVPIPTGGRSDQRFLLNASAPEVPRMDDPTTDTIIHITPTAPVREEAKEYLDYEVVNTSNLATALPLYDIHGNALNEKPRY